jgi:hypothetical protein
VPPEAVRLAVAPLVALRLKAALLLKLARLRPAPRRVVRPRRPEVADGRAVVAVDVALPRCR